ncbi:MAG: HaeIII family restriction endonuclease [Thermoguttaceae bacterium]|nr:HaeIII family restriction endonuclease [Thermoguttaceae bacterium]
MSKNSNNQGRAYEYIWIQTLYEALYRRRKTRIIENSSLLANKKAWSKIDQDLQDDLTLSAQAAIDMLLELEPMLLESNNNDELTLEFQTDKKGVEGDVRDIVIRRECIAWVIGLSIKHRHEDAKHSRLSKDLDFGNIWYGLPCSQRYKEAIKSIFTRLEIAKNENKNWTDIQDKEETVYIPLLQAFIDEINRAYKKDRTLPEKLLEYLIGSEDYYKIISHDEKRITLIRTFNVHNTLNKQDQVNISIITVPIVELPTELVVLRFKKDSKTTVEMYLNNGWQISFRIHNASRKVEPSLKFAIKFEGMPATVMTFVCEWKTK